MFNLFDSNMRSVLTGILATSLTLILTIFTKNKNQLLQQELILKDLEARVLENTETMRSLGSVVTDLKIIMTKLETIIEIKLGGDNGKNIK